MVIKSIWILIFWSIAGVVVVGVNAADWGEPTAIQAVAIGAALIASISVLITTVKERMMWRNLLLFLLGSTFIFGLIYLSRFI